MKRIILITLFLNVTLFSYSQDLIILRSGDEIKSKVSEINSDEIVYKKYSNLKGPNYKLSKSEIFMIKFENGEKELFKENLEPVEVKVPDKIESSSSLDEKSKIKNTNVQLNLNARGIRDKLPNDYQTIVTLVSENWEGDHEMMVRNINIQSNAFVEMVKMYDRPGFDKMMWVTSTFNHTKTIKGVKCSDYKMALSEYKERLKSKNSKKIEDSSLIDEKRNGKYNDDLLNSNYIIDERDGYKYKIGKIGNQTWMLENLNFRSKESLIYNNDVKYRNKFGLLYKWDDAMNACPDGWRLPTIMELDLLIDYFGGKKGANKALKSIDGWKKNTGTNSSGFNALPGGMGNYKGMTLYDNPRKDGKFTSNGRYGYFWLSSETKNIEYNQGDVFEFDGNKIYKGSRPKYQALSCRCIKEN